MIDVIKRLVLAIWGVGFFEFLQKVGWKAALALILAAGIVVGVVLFGIAVLIGLLL